MTLVTLDCGPFDIATSVSDAGAAVYSLAVLRLGDQREPLRRLVPGQGGHGLPPASPGVAARVDRDRTDRLRGVSCPG